MEFYKALGTLLRRDDGERSFSCRTAELDIETLGHELFLNAHRVLIITGFPVCGEDGHVCCETDGPSGAVNLARAFIDLGREVRLVTDTICYQQVYAAANSRAPDTEILVVTKQNHKDPEYILGDFVPTHVFSLERPGQARDGHCHNAKGLIIDQWISEMDSLFAYEKSHGAVTVGIGDGGNELGMGNYKAVTEALYVNDDVVAAEQTSDWPLVAGVSNWWGWGIAALLSLESGRLLLPTPEEEEGLLKAVVLSGGMDGITKRSELSVDALPLERHLLMLDEITQLTKNALQQRGVYV